MAGLHVGGLSGSALYQDLGRRHVDSGVPVGCVRVAAAHVSTAALGAMFGPISVERA